MGNNLPAQLKEWSAKIEELNARTYWSMGMAGARVLILPIIVREFARSLMGRQYGVP